MALAPLFPTSTSGLFDELFGTSSLTPFMQGGGGAITGRPLMPRALAVDVVETPTEFKVKVDAPGATEKDINVEIEGQVLRLSISKEDEREEKGDEAGYTYHRIERSSQYASRALRFPDNADMSKVDAKMENGVLTVCVGKSAATGKRKVELTGGSGGQQQSLPVGGAAEQKKPQEKEGLVEEKPAEGTKKY